jgi:hypothetical protein
LTAIEDEQMAKKRPTPGLGPHRLDNRLEDVEDRERDIAEREKQVEDAVARVAAANARAESAARAVSGHQGSPSDLGDQALFPRGPAGSQAPSEGPGGDLDASQRKEQDREMIRALQDISSKLSDLYALGASITDDGVMIKFP